MLVAERGNETVLIAMCIQAVARGALLVDDPAPERDVRTLAGHCALRGFEPVQVCCKVHPALRILYGRVRKDAMHRTALALVSAEVGELPDQISESLPGKRRNRLRTIALALRTVATGAVIRKQALALVPVGVQTERQLRRPIHRFFRGRYRIDPTHQDGGGGQGEKCRAAHTDGYDDDRAHAASLARLRSAVHCGNYISAVDRHFTSSRRVRRLPA